MVTYIVVQGAREGASGWSLCEPLFGWRVISNGFWFSLTLPSKTQAPDLVSNPPPPPGGRVGPCGGQLSLLSLSPFSPASPRACFTVQVS